MITGEARETLSSSSNKVEYGADMNSTFFRVVSDNIYEHKVAAVVRETISNAIDSHVDAGHQHIPIRVTLPNVFEPNFTVEDFGIGLDAYGVETVFATYFGSDKRDSNDAIGGFGIGSKAPFAISDTFTIRARKDGYEYTYFASIASDKPELIRTTTRSTDEPNGVQVSVPVRERDFRRVHSECKFIFSFFHVPIDVDGGETDLELHCDDVQEQLQENGYVTFDANTASTLYSGNKFYVLMGGVCYPVPGHIIDKCNNLIGHMAGYGKAIAFPCPIGSVAPAASRETLSLDDDTEEYLASEINKFVEDFKADTVQAIEQCSSVYDAINTTKKHYPHYARDISQAFKYKGKSLFQWGLRDIVPIFVGPYSKFLLDFRGGSRICRKIRSDYTLSSVCKHIEQEVPITVFYREEDDPSSNFMTKVNRMVREAVLDAPTPDEDYMVFHGPISEHKRNRISVLFGGAINWVSWKSISHLVPKKERRGNTGHDRGEKADNTIYAKSVIRSFEVEHVKHIEIEAGKEYYYADDVRYDPFDLMAHQKTLGFTDRRPVVLFRNHNNAKRIAAMNIPPIQQFYDEVMVTSEDIIVCAYIFQEILDCYFHDDFEWKIDKFIVPSLNSAYEYSSKVRNIIDEYMEKVKKLFSATIGNMDEEDNQRKVDALTVPSRHMALGHPLVKEFNDILDWYRTEYRLFVETYSSVRRNHEKELIEMIDFSRDMGFHDNLQDIEESIKEVA